MPQKNIEILESLKRVRIEINSVFYPWFCVEETLKKFEGLCNWESKEEPTKFIIILIPKKDVDLEKLGYEFMNHLFAKVKESVT